jgi:hypothetical protein
MIIVIFNGIHKVTFVPIFMLSIERIKLVIKNKGQYYHQKMRRKKYYFKIDFEQKEKSKKLACRDLFDHTRYDIIPLQYSQPQHIILPLISLEYIRTYQSIRAFQHIYLSIYFSMSLSDGQCEV